MRIRHLVARENVDPDRGAVLDAKAVRHGLLVAARVAALAGPIDPRTHLNLDFPAHRADACLVVEMLEPGAEVCRDDEGGFLYARVPPAAWVHLGRVDEDALRLAWHDCLAGRSGARCGEAAPS